MIRYEDMIDQQDAAHKFLDEQGTAKPTTAENVAPKEPTLLDMDDMATSSREKDDDFVFEDDLFGSTEALSPKLEAIDQDIDYQIWFMENLNKPMTEVPPQLQQLTPVEMARLLVHTSSWIVMLEGDKSKNYDDPDEAIIASLKKMKEKSKQDPAQAFPSLADEKPAKEVKPVIPGQAFEPLAGSEHDQPADAAPAPTDPNKFFTSLADEPKI